MAKNINSMGNYSQIRCASYLLILVSIFTSATGYRILGLFPLPSKTHDQFFHPIMHALAEAGHNVTVVSYFPDPDPPSNYEDIPFTEMETLSNAIDLNMFANRNKLINIEHFVMFGLLYHFGKESCEFAYNSTAIQKILKLTNTFDVIIMEQFNTDCMMGVAWKLQAPVIGLSSCPLMPWHHNRVANPNTASYIPSLFMGYSDNMSYMQRLSNWIATHAFTFLYRQLNDRAADSLIREHLGNDVPSVTDLVKQTSLMLINKHYSFSGAYPLSPAVIEVGGIHIKEAKPLDEKLQKLLDSSMNGVIFVSWGSLIKADTMLPKTREALVEAFGSLEQTVIWKWENDTLPNKPKNVHIHNWWPQRDILNHPNTRLFLSHGGMNSISETVYCGVPVIVTPFLGDQFLNSAAVAARGMGTVVLYEDITKESVVNAIQLTLEPSFQENARKVSYSFRNRIRTPKETAVWWVEHVAATGGVPLTKSHSIFMSTVAFYSLDVYATLIVCFIFSTTTWILLLKRCLRKSKKSKKSKSQ